MKTMIKIKQFSQAIAALIKNTLEYLCNQKTISNKVNIYSSFTCCHGDLLLLSKKREHKTKSLFYSMLKNIAVLISLITSAGWGRVQRMS